VRTSPKQVAKILGALVFIAALGVNAFLGKPYHESELLREVAAHLGT